MDKDRKIQMEVKTAEVEKIIKSENIGFFRIMLTMASLLASSCFPTDVWIAVKKTTKRSLWEVDLHGSFTVNPLA